MLALMFWAFPVSAQRAIVVTRTLSAARVTAGVYVELVDFGAEMALPGPIRLAGVSPISPSVIAPAPENAARVFVSTGEAVAAGGDGESASTYVSSARPVRFAREAAFEGEAGWREFVACGLTDPATGTPALLLAGSRRNEDGAWEGRARLWRGVHAEEPDSAARWTFPGSPVAAVAMPGAAHALLLCRGAYDQSVHVQVVHPFHPAAGSPEEEAASIPIQETVSQFRSDPAGIAVTGDGQYVLVLTTGYSLERPSGETRAWLHSFDARSLSPSCAPLEVPGGVEGPDCALHVAGDASCWIATRPRGTEFAYVTRVRVTPLELVKESQTPLIGVMNALRVAPAPDGRAIAVAVDDRVEVWCDEDHGEATYAARGPVTALKWTAEGLFAGEAGRVCLLDEYTLEPKAAVSLQSGWVHDILPLGESMWPADDPDSDGLDGRAEAALGTSPLLPDTDGDGILDSLDPAPLDGSPRLEAPRSIVFDGGAAGEELKGIAIRAEHGKYYAWTARYDRERMPWLVSYPASGTLPGVVYMGIHPVHYAPGTEVSGDVEVRLEDPRTNRSGSGSPATIRVSVTPPKDVLVRRILWLREGGEAAPSSRGESGARHLGELMKVLAGPPDYFAHRELKGPFQESLQPYAVVVVEARAAARGALTRSALLDYVVQGGGLLLLGECLPGDASPALAQWLVPAGIEIDLATRTHGAFASESSAGPIDLHRSLTVHDGCALYATEPLVARVPVDTPAEASAFAAKRYGRGRVAVLAASTPLEDGAVGLAANRPFAESLFRWLAGATERDVYQDMDSDGLPDYIEDANGNGVTDPGETDYLNPDTDGDGLWDGIEDANLNGRVDDNESSPLNADSDGDGVFDGADPSPLPPTGAPRVERVSPAECPAEGGALVLVSGRNFAPDAVVRFGDAVSPSVRVLRTTDLIAEVPAFANGRGGEVTVAVFNPSADIAGVLPGGFHFSPLSRVHLRLDSSAVRREADMLEGEISLVLDAPEQTQVTHVIATLSAAPQERVHWGEIRTPTPEPAGRQAVLGKTTSDGQLLVVVVNPKRNAALRGPIATIPWSVNAAEAGADRIRVTIEQPYASVQNGERLDVTTSDATLPLDVPAP